MSNIIDFNKARAERLEAKCEEAHEGGEVFKLINFDFADEKSDLPSVNLVDDEARPVAILVGSSYLGLQMSKSDARKLAVELLAISRISF